MFHRYSLFSRILKYFRSRCLFLNLSIQRFDNYYLFFIFYCFHYYFIIVILLFYFILFYTVIAILLIKYFNLFCNGNFFIPRESFSFFFPRFLHTSHLCMIQKLRYYLFKDKNYAGETKILKILLEQNKVERFYQISTQLKRW